MKYDKQNLIILTADMEYALRANYGIAINFLADMRKDPPPPPNPPDYQSGSCHNREHLRHTIVFIDASYPL